MKIRLGLWWQYLTQYVQICTTNHEIYNIFNVIKMHAHDVWETICRHWKLIESTLIINVLITEFNVLTEKAICLYFCYAF